MTHLLTCEVKRAKHHYKGEISPDAEPCVFACMATPAVYGKRCYRRLHDCTSTRAGISCYGWIRLREAAAFEMSSKEVVQAINRLTREGFDLLGASDGSALFDFVEHLCRDDPDDYEVPQVRYRSKKETLPNAFSYR